jgi:glycosyltransferase involved in cell wall biosynthesis
MKIAWVTPFSRRSAIGRVSATATQILGERGHEVRIIRSELDATDRGPTYPTRCPVSWWHDLPARELEQTSDAIVLNIGDNYHFHAGVLPYIDAVPCLGIFHDFYLYNFFHEWIVVNGLGEDVYKREIRLTYGEVGFDVADRAWRNETSIAPHGLADQDIADVLPMTEWLAGRCCAAIAHSRFYVDRLTGSCPGPVAVTPLCFDTADIPPPADGKGDEVVVTTVGILNPNKCIDAVIKAIASSPNLKRRCRYRLVGAISGDEKTRLAALCAETGYSRVDILGEVNDATFAAELERADILSCLRKPVIEGASASAIEGMKSGRPIIVPDAGFFLDLPDDLVFKVPRSIDVQALAGILERLVSNETLRRETGAKARQWALKTFSAEVYVNSIESLIKRFIEAKPLLALGERLGHQLAALGISADDPAIGRLAEVMHDLFGTAR